MALGAGGRRRGSSHGVLKLPRTSDHAAGPGLAGHREMAYKYLGWTGLALRYSPRRAGTPGDCHGVCRHKVLTGCVQRASRLGGQSWRLHKIWILTAPCGGPRIPINCETGLTQERALCRDTTTTSPCLVSDSPSSRGYKRTTSRNTVPTCVWGWLNTINASLVDCLQEVCWWQKWQGSESRPVAGSGAGCEAKQESE